MLVPGDVVVPPVVDLGAPEIMAEHRRAAETSAARPTSRMAAGAIVLMWMAGAAGGAGFFLIC